MWNLPGPGFEPVSPALAGRFLTPGPPGKSSPAILPTHLSMSWPCLEALQGLNTPLQSWQPPFWNPASLLPPPSLTYTYEWDEDSNPDLTSKGLQLLLINKGKPLLTKVNKGNQSTLRGGG